MKLCVIWVWCGLSRQRSELKSDCQYEQSKVLHQLINSIVTNNYLRNYIDFVLVAIYNGSGLVTNACCFS